MRTTVCWRGILAAAIALARVLVLVVGRVPSFGVPLVVGLGRACTPFPIRRLLGDVTCIVAVHLVVLVDIFRTNAILVSLGSLELVEGVVAVAAAKPRAKSLAAPIPIAVGRCATLLVLPARLVVVVPRLLGSRLAVTRALGAVVARALLLPRRILAIGLSRLLAVVLVVGVHVVDAGRARAAARGRPAAAAATRAAAAPAARAAAVVFAIVDMMGIVLMAALVVTTSSVVVAAVVSASTAAVRAVTISVARAATAMLTSIVTVGVTVAVLEVVAAGTVGVPGSTTFATVVLAAWLARSLVGGTGSSCAFLGVGVAGLLAVASGEGFDGLGALLLVGAVLLVLLDAPVHEGHDLVVSHGDLVMLLSELALVVLAEAEEGVFLLPLGVRNRLDASRVVGGGDAVQRLATSHELLVGHHEGLVELLVEVADEEILEVPRTRDLLEVTSHRMLPIAVVLFNLGRLELVGHEGVPLGLGVAEKTLAKFVVAIPAVDIPVCHDIFHELGDRVVIRPLGAIITSIGNDPRCLFASVHGMLEGDGVGLVETLPWIVGSTI